MLKYTQIDNTLGKTFADGLEEVVINSGKELVFTKRQMIEEIGCANFQAATRINKAFRRLDISTIKKLSDTDPSSLLRIKGIGQTSIYVAMCILDAHHISVEKWWGWNQEKDNILKFSAYRNKLTRKARKHKQEIA